MSEDQLCEQGWMEREVTDVERVGLQEAGR